MISTRSSLLLKSLDHQVFNSTFVRHFASPAVRRFKKKNQLRAQPTVETAKNLPTSFGELDNATLLTVAALNNHQARCEVLKRHIMSVDMCSYEDACATFDKIAKKNREGMGLAALPYQLGIATGVFAAVGSIPMVFDLQSTLWFNEFFVTTEVPGSEDLETPLEVGAWAWNWMEPPLGTFSFVLLCLQFSRAQMENLGVRPYTTVLKEIRGKNVARTFPRYDKNVIMAFCQSDPLMKVSNL